MSNCCNIWEGIRREYASVYNTSLLLFWHPEIILGHGQQRQRHGECSFAWKYLCTLNAFFLRNALCPNKWTVTCPMVPLPTRRTYWPHWMFNDVIDVLLWTRAPTSTFPTLVGIVCQPITTLVPSFSTSMMCTSSSTGSLSHLRTMLPESSSCPQPAQRPNHAT